MLDCHTHTHCSFDSQEKPQVMIDTALARGIRIYAITDHCDHCSDLDNPALTGTHKQNWQSDTGQAFRTAQAMKDLYENKPIKVLTGIELGQPMQDLEIAQQVIQREYDIVIGSLHNVSGETDFFWLDYQSLSPEELHRILQQYFHELCDMIRWGGFDTLAHLTYPLRYLRQHDIAVNLDQFEQEISEILSLLIRHSIALELNTSGLARGWGYTMPDEQYLTQYRQMGGRYLTIGSDAHAKEGVGGGIAAGIQMALRAGFSHVTYFENRQPVLLKID